VLQPVVLTDCIGYQRHKRFHAITLIQIPVVKSRNSCGAEALDMAIDSSRPRQPRGCCVEAPAQPQQQG